MMDWNISLAERNGWKNYIDVDKKCVSVPDPEFKADYIVFLSDDSMEGEKKPFIQNQTNCLINCAAPVENGCVVAVLIDGRVYIRFYEMNDRRLFLTPNNPNYETLVYDWDELSKVKILGRAVEGWRVV